MPPPQPNLLTPPPNIPPPTALALSQKAPLILSNPPTSSLPWPLSLLFTRETPETWAIHENAFYACLRTGDESSARSLLDRLTARFGAANERIIALRGLYEEATAKDDKELEKVFDGYEKILREDPTNMSIRKRRVAVLKSLGRLQDAVAALGVLVENSPSDAEAWAEASELYARLGMWGQAVYCAEEVLGIMPNAWSAHAHLATLHHLLSTSSPFSPSSPSLPALVLALKHFARSTELNDSYLRGFYGLKLVASRLLPLLPATTNKDEDVPIPSVATVQKLEEVATKKLAEIVRNYGSGKKGWTGFDEAEVTAVRELLDRKGE